MPLTCVVSERFQNVLKDSQCDDGTQVSLEQRMLSVVDYQKQYPNMEALTGSEPKFKPYLRTDTFYMTAPRLKTTILQVSFEL